MIIYIILFIILLSDIISTEYGIRKKLAREVNPLMKNAKVRHIFEVIQLFIPPALYICCIISGIMWIDYIVYFLIIFRGIVVISNFFQLIEVNLYKKRDF